MNTKKNIVNVLFLINGTFLFGQSEIDMHYSILDKPSIKTTKSFDKSLLLELAKAVAELKSATTELKEVKAKEQEIKIGYAVLSK